MENCVEFEMNAAFFGVALTIVSILSCAVEEAAAAPAGTCTFHQGQTTAVVYCENGCCQDACCSASGSSAVDTSLVLIIIGVVVGVILVVLIIIAAICCFKEKKKDRDTEDKTATKHAHEKAVSAEPEKDDPKKPERHREKATSRTPVNSHSPAKKPQHPKVTILKQTTSVHPAKSAGDGVSHGARRHLGNHRNSRARPSDPVLPQVEELEEDESVM